MRSPCALSIFDSLVDLLPGVESFRCLCACISHEDRYGLDVQIVVQIPLSEGSPAHAEVEFDSKVLLHDGLDLADLVAGQIAVGEIDGLKLFWSKEESEIGSGRALA